MKGQTKKTRAGGWLCRAQRAACMLALLLVACGLASREVSAAALDGTFEVRSAYVTVDGGVFQINAHTEYPINDEIRTALTDGVTLYFDLEVRVERRRRLWMDATVVELTLRRELAYHAVKERYVVRDLARGEQEFFVTLDQALQALGQVSNYPVVVEPQLEADASYEIGVRAGVRRGSMPGAVRALMWWSDSWRRRTDWYTWSLPR
jgi:hypothetical protein